MDHGMPVPMEAKKQENKLTGFNVRILDDGSFLMRTSNKNYAAEKEYSFETIESLSKEIKMMLSKIMGKEKDNDDALEKEKE